MISAESLITIAITTLFTGIGTGAGVALGTWGMTHHVIHRFEKDKKAKKGRDTPKKHGRDNA